MINAASSGKTDPTPRHAMVGETHSAPDVKQQLAAIRMLFGWLITGQTVPHNP